MSTIPHLAMEKPAPEVQTEKRDLLVRSLIVRTGYTRPQILRALSDGLPLADRDTLSAFRDELRAAVVDDTEGKATRRVLGRLEAFLSERQAEWDQKLQEYTTALLLDPTADPDEVEGEAEQLLLDAISYRQEGRIENAMALEEEAAPLLLKARLTKLAAELEGAKTRTSQ